MRCQILNKQFGFSCLFSHVSIPTHIQAIMSYYSANIHDKTNITIAYITLPPPAPPATLIGEEDALSEFQIQWFSSGIQFLSAADLRLTEQNERRFKRTLRI